MEAESLPIRESSRELALRTTLEAIEPIIGMLLEVGVSCPDFINLIRWSYVDQAASRQERQRRKRSISRIAAASGLSRADVRVLLAEPRLELTSSKHTDRACWRVIAGWRTDPDFLDEAGKPRSLGYAEATIGFTALAHRYARDIPPRAMLNELLDSRLVVEHSAGQFLPAPPTLERSQSQRAAIENFGNKLAPLGSTLLRNLRTLDQKATFNMLSTSEKIDPLKKARVVRELERRCQTFSNSIERFLLDHTYEPDLHIAGQVESNQIGVLVACIDTSEALGDATPKG